jgi:putative membrane protein insertion efficiency factor
MLKFLLDIPRLFLLGLIKVYQKTISFDHGFLKIFYPHGFCRFTPTCSEYGAQAIAKYGAVKGMMLASWRVMRCNPWSKGGYDPLK